jgi:hypothetical protein
MATNFVGTAESTLVLLTLRFSHPAQFRAGAALPLVAHVIANEPNLPANRVFDSATPRLGIAHRGSGLATISRRKLPPNIWIAGIC